MLAQREIRTVTSGQGHHLITPDSLALVLAYVHRYAPRRVADARFLRAADLRSLAAWIGLPHPRLRSLRQHTLLAAHVTLLQAAGLLATDGSPLTLRPTALRWLFMPRRAQLEHLLAALEAGEWRCAVDRLRLEQRLTVDYVAYVRQTLQRQLDEIPAFEPPYATWRLVAEEQWQLTLAEQAPPYVCFDLLQLGEWTPLDRTLTLTPLTVATAGQRGYSLDYARSLLEEATAQSLPAGRRRVLASWLDRGGAYHLQTVRLLQTERPQQLADLLAQKRLRSYITKQVGPRQAVLAGEGIAPLQKWLARRGYPLSGTGRVAEKEAAEPDDPSFQWLGLRLLVALGDLMPLPYAAPHADLEALSAKLAPAKRSALEALCDEIMERLRQAIAGQDAFFPARSCPSPALLAQIEKAICQESALAIDYEGLGDDQPRRRQVYPLRLEQRGQLFYLHAYCLLAEAERTFRLDRVRHCHSP